MNEIEKIKSCLLDLCYTLKLHNGSNMSLTRDLSNIMNKVRDWTPPDNKGYQGVGKWYVSISGNIWYLNKVDSNNDMAIGYGYDKVNEKWINYEEHIAHIDNIERLATTEEITQAILKGCKQHGIVEGARVKWMSGGVYGEVMEIKSKEYRYSEADNRLCSINNTDGRGGFLDVVCVFDNGEFANVVKEETELRGHEVIIEPTDRELLMECLDKFEQLQALNKFHFVDNLITKLTEHLNNK